MENEAKNKALHEWFGIENHRHEWRMPEGETIFKCIYCKIERGLEGQFCRKYPLSDLSVESGFFALLNGLEKKGFAWNFSRGFPSKCDVRLFLDDDPGTRVIAHEDTLPATLFAAAWKAYESEKAMEAEQND